MFMYLRKNKKGFTLIELMVVVAIIGILALLGLRLYTGQQDKAKEALVKANAGTVQTLIQANLADGPISGGAQGAIDGLGVHGMQNPFGEDDTEVVIPFESDGVIIEGVVVVTEQEEGTEYLVEGWGKNIGTTDKPVISLTAQR